MPRQITTYGPFQARLFRKLDRLRALDATGFAEELSFRAGRTISPVNVTHWKQGTQHFPMDAMVTLAEFCDDAGGHSGVDLVFGPLLRELGYKPVPIDAEQAVRRGEPATVLHRALRETTDVAGCLVAAQDPEGPGGASLTREEAARLKPELAELRRAIDALEVLVDDALGAKPALRVS